MPLFLTNGSNDIIDFQEGIPPEYDGAILRGGNTIHYLKKSCRLIIQEIITDLFILRFNVFRFFENLTIDSVSTKHGLHCRIMLKEKLHHRIKGVSTIFLREGELTMLWSASANCITSFEKDKEYKSIDIFYSPDLLEELIDFFPRISEMIFNKQTKILLKSPSFITPAMREVVHQILENPFDEGTSQLYYDLKVREFLFLILQYKFKGTQSRYRFNEYEQSCIIKAHSILLDDISKKPLSIPQLARAVALNEFKLKAGFKQFYGTTIFECLHHARMEKARELLLTTNKPLKYICVLTGYPRMTNFITAFRKKFGYTPGSLRRQ